MKAVSALFACLLLATPVLAQDKPAEDATSNADKLDLSVSRPTSVFRNDPPGTWYGDTSGVPASANSADRSEASTREDRCQGELHGSVAAGVGYSSHGGNSNWQAANLNSCKTYYNDEGEAREVGVSISVGQFDGPDGRFGGSRQMAPRPMGAPRR